MANNPSALVRPHFFERQQLRAADLMAGQAYVRERLRRHNRFLHGWGVVCGAQVVRAPSGSLWTLAIGEGYAVTPHGDEIYIPAGTTFNVEPGVETCLGIPPPCPDPEDLAEVAGEGPVRVIRANIDPAGLDAGNYNEEWVDLLLLEETHLNGYVLEHVTNPGTPREGRELYYRFSESAPFAAGTVIRIHSGAQRHHAEPEPEITHRYRAGPNQTGNWRLNNIGDTIFVFNAGGQQVDSASFLPGSLVPIGEGIVYLVACPADEQRCPQPAVPANCEPAGGRYEYSRIHETVQFKIVCDLPPSHQEEGPDCATLEEIVCGRAHVPCPPATAEDDNCVVLARIAVGGDTVLQIDDLSERRQLLSESLLLAYLRCRCEPAEVQCVDFEDLPLNATLNVGDSFVSSGVTVTGQTFFFSSGAPTNSGFARIEDGGLAAGSGHEAQVNNINLAFDFGSALPGLTMRFGEFGGNLNLEINGDTRNFESFAQIAGETIGGVAVSIIVGAGQAQGTLVLQGQISSFAIGGQELWIDDVCPATAGILVAGPPAVSFTAQPVTGTAPLTVGFTDQSSGQITGWAWSFGDGQTSNQQNPVHAFTAPGTYQVTLTVSGPGGTATAGETIRVTPQRTIVSIAPNSIQGSFFTPTTHQVAIFGQGLADAAAVTFVGAADAITGVAITARADDRLDLVLQLRAAPAEGRRPFIVLFPDGAQLASGSVRLDIRSGFIIGVAGETFTVELDPADFDLQRGREEALESVGGIGAVRGERLRAAGVSNVLELLVLPPERTAEIAGVSVEIATGWQEASRVLLRR
jgi:PKD repeat protein